MLWFDFWLTLRDKPEKSRKDYFLLIAEPFFKLKYIRSYSFKSSKSSQELETVHTNKVSRGICVSVLNSEGVTS